MADRPILFSGPMVRALLAGTKTQTRRILKPQPELQGNGLYHVSNAGGGVLNVAEEDVGAQAVDYLRISVGDRLWVREAHAILPRTAYRGSIGVGTIAQVEHPTDEYSAALFREGFDRSGRPLWRPSIHMPRWASRLTLTVTDVRVERVQDCSEADAIAEGMTQATADAILSTDELQVYATTHLLAPDARGRILYETIWDQINGDGSWASNPWVAAYTFTVERGNIDQLASHANG